MDCGHKRSADSGKCFPVIELVVRRGQVKSPPAVHRELVDRVHCLSLTLKTESRSIAKCKIHALYNREQGIIDLSDIIFKFDWQETLFLYDVIGRPNATQIIQAIPEAINFGMNYNRAASLAFAAAAEQMMPGFLTYAIPIAFFA